MVLPWIPVAAGAGGDAQTCIVLGVGPDRSSVANVYFRDVQHFVTHRAPGALLLGADRLPGSRSCPKHKDGPRRRRPGALHLRAEPARRGSSRPSATCSTTCASRRSATSLYLARVGGRLARGRLWVFTQARAASGGGGVSATPAIAVDDVSKRFRLYHERNQSLKAAVLRGGRARYEEFWALDGRVVRGARRASTFGLIGENGSGKSTLLKCIARILRPDKGSIAARRQDLGAARARRRLPPRAVGPRERLPQRRDPRPVARSSSTRASTRSSTSPASSSSSTRR